MQRLLPVYRADPDAYDLSSIRRFWHLAAPCPPAIKQAWIDLLGPRGGLGALRRHRITGADVHHRRAVADASRLGRRRRRRRDEGARRRRQRVPARRGRRDLHAAVAGQRADIPLRRRHRQEPRRLGLARRPRLFRRGRLPVSLRPAGGHVHRRRPQRLPRRDRIGAVGAPGCVVLLGGWRTRRRSGPGAACHRAGRRSRRGRRHAFLSERIACVQGAAAPSSSATPRCATTPARRAGRRCATRSSRDGRLRRVGDRTIKRRMDRSVAPSAAARLGTATRPARSSPPRSRSRTPPSAPAPPACAR